MRYGDVEFFDPSAMSSRSLKKFVYFKMSLISWQRKDISKSSLVNGIGMIDYCSADGKK